jgi:hypothetical protein
MTKEPTNSAKSPLGRGPAKDRTDHPRGALRGTDEGLSAGSGERPDILPDILSTHGRRREL